MPAARRCGPSDTTLCHASGTAAQTTRTASARPRGARHHRPSTRRRTPRTGAALRGASGTALRGAAHGRVTGGVADGGDG
ncbi:hypothetical protein [Lentzea guizhouensis]|uniref:hypothetical protein n=1 Tax=Lentzea guizhouensis TaxID=1586287 RepID=UPI0012B68374|nr:hypothetical protein [Lentzea guizhouensis]